MKKFRNYRIEPFIFIKKLSADGFNYKNLKQIPMLQYKKKTYITFKINGSFAFILSLFKYTQHKSKRFL